MTLEEAIKHCEEVADLCEYEASEYDMTDIYESHVACQEDEWGECAAKYRQIAEWLRELKKRREVMEELKPCPFCGTVPRLYWEPWKEISPTCGIYVLEADHKGSCYIRHINGMNLTGRTSSSNKKCLIDWWNRRASDGET